MEVIKWEDGGDQVGRWRWSRHENTTGQELEEGRPPQRRIGKASEEGQNPPRAVKPTMMMMMMMIRYQ